MAETGATGQMITEKKLRKLLAVLCTCGICMCGCATRRTPAKPAVNFIAVVRPVLPTTTAKVAEEPPDLEVAALPDLPTIGPPHPPPVKPHVAPVTTQEPSAEKHVEPTIAPEVPTQEVTEAKAESQHSLDVAEKNLSMTQGKKLNAMQEDLASKVRGFADNAREAMKSEDWVRAKNLSKKAEVLSEQLASSL
jgi:type IV secretory pathway VirB10-like protein